jgi:hypothetical protein
MKVTLVKIFIETDSHGLDVEMFRVYKEIDTLIEPKIGHHLTLLKGENFYVEKLEQNIKEGKIILYRTYEISHCEFWGDWELFIDAYLPSLLKKEWIYDEKKCKQKFSSQIIDCVWRDEK